MVDNMPLLLALHQILFLLLLLMQKLIIDLLSLYQILVGHLELIFEHFVFSFESLGHLTDFLLDYLTLLYLLVLLVDLYVH